MTGDQVRELRRRGGRAGDRVRVTLSPAAGSDDPASVWASARPGAGGAVEVDLGRDDLGVEPGWLVAGRGLNAVVASVSGGVLTCTGVDQ